MVCQRTETTKPESSTVFRFNSAFLQPHPLRKNTRNIVRPALCLYPICHATASPPPPPRVALTTPPGHPLFSLSTGQWFKLICGASSHDTPAIHNLCAVYTAAGADCIDVACDISTVLAARAGISEGMGRRSSSYEPLLMVSVNAAEDPHFRKARFDVRECPESCRRPCEVVCPAVAINALGVLMDRCYGCGRCVPACPIGIIETVDHVHDIGSIRMVLGMVEALEIHTGAGQLADFRRLWEGIREAALRLDVVAVSLPDLGEDKALEEGLCGMWEILERGGIEKVGARLIWQADGRPMSGDIGRGTAKAAVKLAKRMRAILTKVGVPGEVQLAGGTNDATVPLLKKEGMIRGTGEEGVGGIGVGGYARKIVREVLDESGGYDRTMTTKAFDRAVETAINLVGGIKTL